MSAHRTSTPDFLYPGGAYAAFLLVTDRITNRVPTVKSAPTSRQITAFWTKPAMIKLTKLTAATVMA